MAPKGKDKGRKEESAAAGRVTRGPSPGERSRGVAESPASVSRRTPDHGCSGGGPPKADYLVGQVANSLARGRLRSGGSTGRLAALFGSGSGEPQLQPLYVPVPPVSHRGVFPMARQSSFKTGVWLGGPGSEVGRRGGFLAAFRSWACLCKREDANLDH